MAACRRLLVARTTLVVAGAVVDRRRLAAAAVVAAAAVGTGVDGLGVLALEPKGLAAAPRKDSSALDFFAAGPSSISAGLPVTAAARRGTSKGGEVSAGDSGSGPWDSGANDTSRCTAYVQRRAAALDAALLPLAAARRSAA